MATASNEDMFDDFLAQRGHETTHAGWDESFNKKQCPECGGLHGADASECTVCGWTPYR